MDRETARANIENFNKTFCTNDNTNATWKEGLANISSELDKMFQTAVPSEVDVDITTPAGTLNIPVTNNMAKSIATEVSKYWMNTVELTGTPVDCDTIDTVSNNADSIESIIESGLLAITNGTYQLPYYNKFINVIADAVCTISWAVHETNNDDCDSDLTVTVT